MFQEEGGRPGDRRGFLHKSFIGRAVGGVVKRVVTATPVGAAAFTAAKFVKSRLTPPRTTTARVSQFSEAEKQLGRAAKFPQAFGPEGGRDAILAPEFRAFGGRGRGRRGLGPVNGQLRSGPCDFPMVLDSQGRCRTPTSGEFGGEQFGVGAAVMGRYGAALEPGSLIVDRAVCLAGMQLGDDGLCYNKGQISNKQRMWPAGRKPLLSGGDMRAISIASRAGRRLEGATKRLQQLGMMKKPMPRRALPHAHAKAATSVVSVPS